MNEENLVTDPDFSPPLRFHESDMFRDGGTVYVSVFDGDGARHDLFFDRDFHRPYYGSVHPDENQEAIRYLDLHGSFASHLEWALKSTSAGRAAQALEWLIFHKNYPTINSEGNTAQQVDAPEPGSNAGPASRSQPPRPGDR